MEVAIVGGTGYGGIELIRLLQQHPCINHLSVYGTQEKEIQLSDVYPHFINEPSRKVLPLKIDELKDHHVVFLATPPGVSTNLSPDLIEGKCKIIDLSGDLRLKSESLYEKWYGKKSAPKHLLNKAIYGLTELNREYIYEASIIANPGCYATATILGLSPLVKAGWIEEGTIIIDGKSGVSGAGKGLNEITHFSNVNENVQIYKVNQHQHIPEIEQCLHVTPITFSTHLIPMTRGIMTTIYCKASQDLTEKQVHELYMSEYGGDSFIRIHPIGKFPSTKMVYGSNYCDIGVTYDERTGMITIVSVIDNLMKGASGQGIQNMNVSFGLDEKIGLVGSPLFP